MKLNEIRKEKKITLQDMARDLNVSYPSVQKWCTGKQKPKVDMAIKIAEYLNCTVEEVWK